MKTPIEKILKEGRSLKLDKNKKNSIKGALLAVMHKNPAPEKAGIIPGFLWHRPIFISASAFVLCLAVVGFASARAQSALPGEALYPVKTGLNEKVLQVLAFSEKAKINLDIQLAQTRLKEAETLASRGKMTHLAQNQVNAGLKIRIENLEQGIQKLNNENNYGEAERVILKFEETLKTHSQTLEKFRQVAISSQSDPALLTAPVGLDTPVSSSALIPSDQPEAPALMSVPAAEKSIVPDIKTVQPRVLGQLEEIKLIVAGARELFNSSQNEISEDYVKKISKNLENAEEKILQAEARISENPPDTGQTMLLAQQARSLAQQAKLQIEIGKIMKIDFSR